ncbi:methyltransferase domain-containing protein [Flavobacterium sp. SM2513]|uniref:methyltransferase domain-containing protein n=1 Tax=Flavobacterium sp. SM2513 TaxID=3424766 RepID=UPI003D7FA04D
MGLNTKYRTDEPEIMDDFLLKGEELRNALDKIAKINQFLGGNKLTLKGLQKILPEKNSSQPITIVDIGCGNGDMLRKIAEYGIKNGYNFNLIGVDANDFTVNHASDLSKTYLNISYLCEDIFKMDFSTLKCDISLCTLTLHHFKDEEIIQILNIFKQNSKLGIVINDLQRSATAYRLFQILCVTFGLNRMSREDGLVSILRGFRKQEIIDFSEKLNFKKYSISWRWAFRYQWIIQNI